LRCRPTVLLPLLATFFRGVALGQADLGGAPAFGIGNLEKFGSSIAQVSDLDGDGVPDLFVGAPDAFGFAGSQAGYVSCRSGADPTVQLGIYYGSSAGERAGCDLVRVGDVDGDGVEDVLVGAPNYAGSAGLNQGRVFVLSGATFSEISTFTTGEAGARFGQTLASVGDRDGDGIAEFLCGAPNADVLVTDGGAVLLMSVNATGFTQLARFDGDEAGENLGQATTGLPDLDGDGLEELVLCSPNWDGPNGFNFGRARVFSSDASSGFPLLNELTGSSSNDLFGYAVAPIGDPGGLAAPRLLVSYIGRSQAGQTLAGGASIVDPLSGSVLLSAAGTNKSEFLGTSVATIGDLDYDGLDDFALGAPAFSPAGAFFGGCVDVFSAQSAGSGQATRLFRLSGIAGQRFGQTLLPAGDVDGDGLPELLMGATGETDPSTGNQVGALHTLLSQRPKLTPDKDHYNDLDTMVLAGVGYANLMTFVVIGTALSGRRDFAIDFSQPWTVVSAPDTDMFGSTAMSGVLPNFNGVKTTLYAQAYMPYANARKHKLLFSEVATININ
jgi:FG-GAP repeat protein